MIEVVFDDSAGGSLKMAQHYGEGEFSSGAIGVIIAHADGSESTEEEIEAAQREAIERERIVWANAVPMGGNAADIYGFSLGLSIGDISENVPGEKRRQVLEWLYSIYPNLEDGSAFTVELMQKATDALNEVCCRISAGESVRIWYSNQPDELCGMYWFMAQLNQLELQGEQIIIVPLPDWEIGDNGRIVTHSGWGGMKPGEWHRYLDKQRMATLSFCENCAAHWKRLQQENAPLRASLNGRLVSASETLYDEFIIREIAAESDEFYEAMIIGRVMGKNELGISDAWIAQRIENMICAGMLLPVTEPAPDSPIYHRRLKKVLRNKIVWGYRL